MSLLRRHGISKAAGGQIYAGNFDGLIYGNLGQHDEYKLEHLELEFYIIFHTSFPENVRLFQIEGDFSNNRGFLAQYRKATNTLDTFLGNTFRSISWNASLDTLYKVNIKLYNQSAYLFIDDVSTGLSVNYGKSPSYNDDGTLLGAIRANSVFAEGTKYIYGLKLWSLTAAGVRVDNFIDISLNEGTGTTSANAATSAPASSDLSFVANGSGNSFWHTL